MAAKTVRVGEDVGAVNGGAGSATGNVRGCRRRVIVSQCRTSRENTRNIRRIARYISLHNVIS